MKSSMRRLVLILGQVLLIMVSTGATSASGDPPLDAMIGGSVVDKGEGVPIAYAHIWIHEQSGKAYLTVPPDSSGKFHAHVSDGYYYVMIGAPGFAPVCKSVRASHDKPVVLNVRLGPDEENLQKN